VDLNIAMEKEHERRARIKQRNELRSAVKIQAVFRSYKCRKDIEEFVEERRVFYQLREEVIQLYASHMNLRLYAFLCVTLGNAYSQ